MNILMIRWKSIVEPDLMDAFQKQGHKIHIWEHVIEDPDYDSQVPQKLSEELLKHSYDFVFSVDYFPIVARICNAVKIIYVSWSVDCPVIQYYSKTLSLPCNRIFLFDYAMYEEFSKYNPTGVFYLPLGANVDHGDEIVKQMTAQDRVQYAADVSFIGSTYEEKCKYNDVESMLSPYTKGVARGLIEAQLRVYGGFLLSEAMTDCFVETFLKETEIEGAPEDYNYDARAMISQFYLGEKVTEQERIRLLSRLSESFRVSVYTNSNVSNITKIENKGTAESRIEMPKIFHLSKINLNMTSKTIQTGLPQRFWDVLGAGGFLLTNMQAELPEYLIPGVDLETYSSFEECEQKVAYYLSHEQERALIAKNGYEKVKANYTYEHRVAQMMAMLSEC